MRKKKWTYAPYEFLHKIALIFNTRNSFRKGMPDAYHACLRRGILNDVCSHMDQVYWQCCGKINKI